MGLGNPTPTVSPHGQIITGSTIKRKVKILRMRGLRCCSSCHEKEWESADEAVRVYFAGSVARYFGFG